MQTGLTTEDEEDAALRIRPPSSTSVDEASFQPHTPVADVYRVFRYEVSFHWRKVCILH